MNAYKILETRFCQRAKIEHAAAILHWDSATMMPTGSAPARAEQLAALQVAARAVLTAPDISDLLDEAEAANGDLDPWQSANLLRMRRQWNLAVSVPEDLMVALTKAGSACELAWRDARAANDFAGLLPKLEAVLGLVRQTAAARASAFSCSDYDALLETYEPGARSARIDQIFADLETFLPPLLEKVLEKQATEPPVQDLVGPFPVDRQRQLSLRFMSALGFDFESGRLDVSHHPFTGGVPDDVRITTRYEEADFTRSLMGTLHETGHALYEAGLPADWRYQPVGEALGMAVHESQSLLIEMQVCRSDAFLAFAVPLMRECLGGTDWNDQNLRRLYRKVAPGLIRVDADEVTYPLHIILRYRLEKALLAGDLLLPDLPGAWRSGMKELLGIVPEDDARGCLQDIHWMDGAFGYFPTYTLGALAAAQLFAASLAQDGDILAGIESGDFRPLLSWLRANVHQHGQRFDTDELLRQASGGPLGTEAFKAHLTERYLTE